MLNLFILITSLKLPEFMRIYICPKKDAFLLNIWITHEPFSAKPLRNKCHKKAIC